MDKTVLAQAELSRLIAHKHFRKSRVLQKLLAFLVDAELHHRPVTESILARELLGLPEEEFHPYTNSHVRVNTSLLRRRLGAYYRETAPGGVRFHLPVGSFRLRIELLDTGQSSWRRAFGQAKLLSTSRYVNELETALRRIDEVVAEQPGFAQAYAVKAHTHLYLGSHGGAPLEHGAEAKKAASRAMELAPDGWQSLAAAGAVAAMVDWDWAAAERFHGLAKATPENELAGDPWYQAALIAMNQVEPCLDMMRRALVEYAVPPRCLQQNYGITLHLARRWDEAQSELRQTAEAFPDDYCV